MNKKGFLDAEVLANPAFFILVTLAVVATVGGFIMSSRMGLESLALWQKVFLIVGEVIACYFIVWKMS